MHGGYGNCVASKNQSSQQNHDDPVSSRKSSGGHTWMLFKGTLVIRTPYVFYGAATQAPAGLPVRSPGPGRPYLGIVSQWGVFATATVDSTANYQKVVR